MMGVKSEVVPDSAACTGVLGATFEGLVEMLIRPSRAEYRLADLGPTQVLVDGACRMKREDWTIVNGRGLRLHGSWWKRDDDERAPSSVVVYLHANSSSRVEALRAGVLRAAMCCGDGCEVVAFDFAGSGWSEGEYVTLGCFERYDVVDVVSFVVESCQRRPGFSCKPRIVLWGRSMGASTAILYSALNGSVRPHGLVLDSPFASVRAIVEDLVTRGTYKLPKAAGRFILARLRKTCKDRTGGASVVDVDVADRAVGGVDAREWLALAAVRRAALGSDQQQQQSSHDPSDARGAWSISSSSSSSSSDGPSRDKKKGAATLCTCPALILGGRLDDFIPPRIHADYICGKYAGPVHSLRFDGSHNSARPLWVRDAAASFVRGALRCDVKGAFDTIDFLSTASLTHPLTTESELTDVRTDFALDRLVDNVVEDLILFAFAVTVAPDPKTMLEASLIACNLATTFHLTSHWHANDLHANKEAWGLVG